MLAPAKVIVIDAHPDPKINVPWRKRDFTCIFCWSTDLASNALTFKGITLCVKCLRLVPLVVNVLALTCKRCARGRES